MNLEELAILGFSGGEIKVYSAILELGTATFSQIHEKTGFERRTIYDIINKLLKKGVIGYSVENRKKTYSCAIPRKLNGEIALKKSGLKKLEELLPQIEKEITEKKPAVSFEILRGKEGIKTVFEEMLAFKETFCIAGGFYVMDLMPIFWAKYNEKRVKAGVKFYNLAKFEMKKRKAPTKRLFYIKYLPKEFSGNPIAIFTYANKVANLLWTGEFSAFLIESKEIADAYRKYFNYLWKNIATRK